jgi:hypothetical protein
MNVAPEDQKLIIQTPKYELDSLLKKITPTNQHQLELEDCHKASEGW